MELDELIRESAPSVGAAPSMFDLRAGVRRRRTRKVRAIGVTVVVAVVAVLIPLLLPGDERNSTVSVRPHPVGRELSSWSRIASVPYLGTVPLPANVEVVESAGNLFVVSSTNSLTSPSQNWVRVWSVDVGTGVLVDLGYDELRPAGTLLGTPAGWQGGPVIAVESADGWFIDHWVDGEWTTLARPDVPPDATRPPWVARFGDDLVASVTTTGTQPEQAWSTADGRTWTDVPIPSDSNGDGYYSGGDQLLRQGFSPAPTGGSLTSILAAGSTEWVQAPAPAFDSYGSMRSVEVDGTLVSCGSQSSEANYDCSRWAPGEERQREVDPPPFDQGHWMERMGERVRLVAVPGRGMIMTDQVGWALYEPEQDRWRRLPEPGSRGGTTSVVEIDGAVYAAMFDTVDVDAEPTVGLYRLEVGGDDPIVPRAVDLGPRFRVRLPSGWTDTNVSPDGWAMYVGVPDRVPDGSGALCMALRVEFELVEPQNEAPPPATWAVPEPSAECVPYVFSIRAGGLVYAVRIYRTAPGTEGDAGDLAEVIGSFRAARFEG